MVQNGQDERFGPNDLIPNQILASATILVQQKDLERSIYQKSREEGVREGGVAQIVRQICTKLPVFRFVHHKKGAQSCRILVANSKVNFRQFYANALMLGQGCLKALFGKQFPPPLKWDKYGFLSTSRNGSKVGNKVGFDPCPSTFAPNNTLFAHFESISGRWTHLKST